MSAKPSAETCLATYGTLAPGQINAHQLDALTGMWSTGYITGTLASEGWGAEHGCPGLILDGGTDRVDAHLFTCEDLPAHWARLDAFEGPGYRRVAVTVQTEAGPVQASLYEVIPG